jgi:prepilin-type N-terminal cleavage/methylation domain-containing protein
LIYCKRNILVKFNQSGAKMKHKAFTLIELLVVISIIAVLMSIMFPALSRARSVSKRVVCANNLHQNAVALFAYTGSDKGGRLPQSNGYTLQYVPTQMYEVLRASFPDTEKTLVCPEFKLFKKQDFTNKSFLYPGLNKVYEWEPFPSLFDDGAGFWIGYYYHGGRDMKDWNWRFIPPDAKRWTSPLRSSDSGRLVLMSDMIEQASGNWFWVEATHRKGGYARVLFNSSPPEPHEAGVQGGNTLYMDGSVKWCNVSNLNKYPRSKPGAYRSYGYWHGDE